MVQRILFAVIFAMSTHASSVFSGDVFDKAERAKECVKANDCNGHKWLGRIMAIKKCQEEGNCSEKINEKIAKNEDKIRTGLGKVETFNRCMNTTNPEEQKQCYETAKAKYRERQSKKAEAAAALQELANEPKTQGDAVCLPGKIALGLVKVNIRGFVEQVSDDRIQIMVSDTQGQDVRYNNVSLQQGTTIWDKHNNWIQCAYLKK